MSGCVNDAVSVHGATGCAGTECGCDLLSGLGCCWLLPRCVHNVTDKDTTSAPSSSTSSCRSRSATSCGGRTIIQKVRDNSVVFCRCICCAVRLRRSRLGGGGGDAANAGVLSVESDGDSQPVTTTVVHRAPGHRMRLPLGASIAVELVGEHFVHAQVSQQTQHAVEEAFSTRRRCCEECIGRDAVNESSLLRLQAALFSAPGRACVRCLL